MNTFPNNDLPHSIQPHNTKPPMNRAEANTLLLAFESGYVSETDPDVERAAKVVGKRAFVTRLPGISNPKASVVVRRVSS